MSLWDDYRYFDGYDDGEDETPVTCKYCGAGALEWFETKAGWRLFDCDGNMHRCNRNDDPAKVFSASPLDKS